jgi:ferredoxin
VTDPVLTVSPGDNRITLAPGETILQGLFAAGFAYRVGCRRGGCGVCKVDLREGSVTYPHVVADSVLTEDERTDGTCLTCRAVPDGDVTIALRDDHLTLKNPYRLAMRETTPAPLTKE